MPTEETSVPYWMYFLSKAAGNQYEVAGKYGFIPQHARDRIWSQWSFDSVPSAWNSYTEPFEKADFDNIMITPANFIQWQKPTDNYWQETKSVIAFTSDVFDSIEVRDKSPDIYLYENWPDMGPRSSSFPPTAAEWKAYNEYLNGDFHSWFLEYHDSLVNAYPGKHVKMIPVGPAISKVLSTPPFNTISIDSLYEDDAPHGRPSIYFLAALATYMAMNHEKAPAGYKPPEFIHGHYMVDKTIIDNYAQAVDIIWEELKAFNFDNGDSRVFIEPLASSIKKQSQGTEYRVYPNPAHHKLFIDGDSEVLEVRIFTPNGKQVINSLHKAVDVSGLRSGLYILEVHFDNAKTERLKLLIY